MTELINPSLTLDANVEQAIEQLEGVESAMNRLARVAGVARPPAPPTKRLPKPDTRKRRRNTVRASRRANR